ncbi:MAG: hypothetical protein ACRDP6_32555 [Actinoallomurus sp.]
MRASSPGDDNNLLEEESRSEQEVVRPPVDPREDPAGWIAII